MINDAFQVLEYQPQPDQWVTVGNLEQARSTHATLSVKAEQLPCFSPGEYENDIKGDWKTVSD